MIDPEISVTLRDIMNFITVNPMTMLRIGRSNCMTGDFGNYKFYIVYSK